MADYSYEQLKDMTVSELRDIAAGIESESLKGYTTMHKEHLLHALCQALRIHSHHAAQGAEKTQIKSRIHTLRKQRDDAMASGQGKEKLPDIRREIHHLKHRLRRMAA